MPPRHHEDPWGTKWVSPNVAYFQMEVVEKVRIHLVLHAAKSGYLIWSIVLQLGGGWDEIGKAQCRPPLRYVLFAVYIYMYMYFIIYICLYIHMIAYVHLYIVLYNYIKSHTHTYFFLNIHTYKRTYVHTYVIIRTYIRTYIRTFILSSIRTYVHTYHYITLHFLHTYITYNYIRKLRKLRVLFALNMVNSSRNLLSSRALEHAPAWGSAVCWRVTPAMRYPWPVRAVTGSMINRFFDQPLDSTIIGKKIR